MRTVDLQEAATHLPRLVQAAVDGEPFIITRAGKPLVEVVSIETPESVPARRTGFLAGEISVPPDFDRMASREVESMFEGGA